MQRRFGVHRPRAAIRTCRSPGDKTGSKDAIGWQVHPISIALNILNFDAHFIGLLSFVPLKVQTHAGRAMKADGGRPLCANRPPPRSARQTRLNASRQTFHCEGGSTAAGMPSGIRVPASVWASLS